ncbi:MAG: hypothetical protein R3Y40_05650 [Eubacteriales bacterium]
MDNTTTFKSSTFGGFNKQQVATHITNLEKELEATKLEVCEAQVEVENIQIELETVKSELEESKQEILTCLEELRKKEAEILNYKEEIQRYRNTPPILTTAPLPNCKNNLDNYSSEILNFQNKLNRYTSILVKEQNKLNQYINSHNTETQFDEPVVEEIQTIIPQTTEAPIDFTIPAPSLSDLSLKFDDMKTELDSYNLLNTITNPFDSE